MFYIILLLIIYFIPEIFAIASFLLATIVTDNVIIGFIAGGIIYLFLFFTVKRELK